MVSVGACVRVAVLSRDVRWMCVVCGPGRAWFRHAWRCRDRRDVRGGACAVLSVARARLKYS